MGLELDVDGAPDGALALDDGVVQTSCLVEAEQSKDNRGAMEEHGCSGGK